MGDVSIYSDAVFDVTSYVNQYYGGFSNPIFYDFIKLFFVILFSVIIIRAIFKLFK